MANKMNI